MTPRVAAICAALVVASRLLARGDWEMVLSAFVAAGVAVAAAWLFRRRRERRA